MAEPQAGHQRKLRVFLLEDNLDDVELEVHEMVKAQLDVEYDVARNKREFTEKVVGFAPDIILADYSLPDITGIEAIKVAKELGVDVPVILITGDGNETIAVDSLRLGAIDYILKKNISGLPARVKRSLEIWTDRKAKERAESEEMRLQQLLFENQKMQAIGRLAGGISHDFNNILTGIMGFSEICLIDIPQDAETRNKLESIISLSQKGADLVKQLLIFSNKMVLEFKIVNMNSFIAETIHFLKRIVEESIDIRLDLHDDLPLVRCDTNQFTQVMMNLILNARDAMHGKGTVTIKTSKCLMREQAAGGAPQEDKRWCICISVTDAGSGIEDHHLPQIFDPFFTTKGVGKGTGLGLSIVYSVVQGHGGIVKVLSRKGEGTTFTIVLPVPEDAASGDEAPFYEKLPVQDSGRISGKETILIAEDEDVLRDMLSNFMRSLGYAVVTARDGQEAFNAYEAEPERYHLIISDMMMPNKNGIELFRDVRAIRPQVKFMLVTGYSLSDVDESILGQMTAILRKPYTPMQLVKVVRDIFDAQPS
ncbi:MAG: response regulator [Nitrospirota bacterium]|nr:response regulator [Nitrospirota bacterium]